MLRTDKKMLRFVISGTIDGEFDFPNELFSGFCYEGWGNAWSLIEGVQARYIPARELINNQDRFSEIDILMAELGQTELHQIAYNRGVFNIKTESGAGFNVDREDSLEKKMNFINQLARCSLVLSTTLGGKEYMKMFSDRPILDIPLPMDMDKFQPRNLPQFDSFTLCLGEIIESCYDDRPLQIEAIAIAKSLGINVVSSIGPQNRNFDASSLATLGFNNVYLQKHIGLYEMSKDWLAKSHVSMMLGQRSTFGRFVYVSWAVGIPCIATRYQCQEQICPELTVSCEEIDKIRALLARLRNDKNFYNEIRNRGLSNVHRILSKETIALRITNEILPIYFKR